MQHASKTFQALLILLSMTIASKAADRGEPLFNGKDLTGWRAPLGLWQAAKAVKLDPQEPKYLLIEEGTGIFVNGPKHTTNNLLTEKEHADVEVHVEFVVPKDSNSGVYLMGRYEIQILDSYGKTDLKYGDCGGVYASCSDPKPDFHGHPPVINASKPPGEWQSYDITFRAPRFDSSGKKTENARFVKVVHNGKVIQENIEVPRPTCSAMSLDEKPTGPLMLQGDHGPVAYRNITLRSITAK